MLINRFCGEIQDGLGDINKKITCFHILLGEKVIKERDRPARRNYVKDDPTRSSIIIRNVTLQTQRSFGDALTKPVIANHLLEDQPYYYDEIVATCKRYDKAMGQQDYIWGLKYTWLVALKRLCALSQNVDNLVIGRLNAGSASATNTQLSSSELARARTSSLITSQIRSVFSLLGARRV